MKTSSTHCRRGVRTAATAVLAALTLVPTAHGYTNVFVDDFNDVNDDGWTRVGADYYQGPPVYSFPNGAYRIQVPPATPDFCGIGGLTYAIGYRTNLHYRDFIAQLGWVAEDPELLNRVALVARARGDQFVNNLHVPAYNNNYSLGTHWDPAVQMQALYLARTEVNGPVMLQTHFFPRVPGRRHRLLFTGQGTHLVGQIFDLQVPTVALATVEASDDQFSGGYVGFLVSDLAGARRVGNQPVDVTLDNFAVGVPDPPYTFTQNFAGGDDTGLTRFEPFASAGVHGVFTFAEGALTMAHPPSPAPDLGPAAVGEFLTELAYIDVDASIDFWGWNESPDALPSFSLCVRQTAWPEGRGDFYSATFNPAGAPVGKGFHFGPHLAIMVWSNGFPLAPSLGVSDVVEGTFIDPHERYQLSISARGPLLTARLFQHPTLSFPIAELSVSDPTYSRGRAGFLASDWGTLAGGNNPPQVTVDNFSVAGVLAPPVLTIQRTNNATMVLSWPAFAPDYVVQSAPGVNGPWTAVAGAVRLVGGRYQQDTAVTNSVQLFRLRQRGLLD